MPEYPYEINSKFRLTFLNRIYVCLYRKQSEMVFMSDISLLDSDNHEHLPSSTATYTKVTVEMTDMVVSEILARKQTRALTVDTPSDTWSIRLPLLLFAIHSRSLAALCLQNYVRPRHVLCTLTQ